MKSDHRRRLLFGMTPVSVACVALIVVLAASSGVAIGLLMRDREAAQSQAGAVAGQSQQLVDCVRDPSNVDCEAEAAKVEKTIDDVGAGEPGPPGATGQNGTNGATGPSGVDGQAGRDGTDGARGPRGFIGPIGPNGLAGAAGADGQNGAQGPAGAPGEAGAPGPAGDPGAPGADGRDGTDGRGIAALTCDQDSQRFVVTYTDGSSEPVDGSDCVAGGGLLP